MKHALKVVWLDLLCLKPYIRQRLKPLMFLQLGIIFALSRSGVVSVQFIGTVTILLTLYITLMLSASFKAEEDLQLQTLYASLGVTRVDIVRGRYLIILLAQIIAFSVALLIGGVLDLISGGVLVTLGTINLFLYTLVGYSTFGMLYAAFLYPFFYRFGYSKVTLVPITALLSLAICDRFFTINKELFDLNMLLDEIFEYSWSASSSAAAYLMGAFALGVSYCISSRFFSRKDLVFLSQSERRPWSKTKSTRYLVNADGSIMKVETTRRWRAHDISQSSRLPGSRRRLSTASELVVRVQEAQRRKEGFKKHQSDLRIFFTATATVAIFFGIACVRYLVMALLQT